MRRRANDRSGAPTAVERFTTSASDLPLNHKYCSSAERAYGSSSAAVGGEAEAHTPFKQREYRDNLTMVLTTDSRPLDAHEPTAEPETLWGRIDKNNYGDRAVQAKPPEIEERLTKSRKKKERDSASAARGADGDVDLARRRRSAAAREESVLSLADDVVYKPQTKEARAAYAAMLSVIQQQFEGQPMDVLGGAAVEVFTILKNDKVKKPDKKKEIDKLLNPITTQMFEQFVSIGKLITDFHDASDPASAPSGGDGVDAYWLQAYADMDPQQSQKLAEEILKIIAEGDDRDVENRLVMELDYEKFDLIKLVLRNRVKKVCGTGLARAEDQEERKKIEEEMMGNPSLVPILEQLHATRPAKERQKNLEKSIRDEAKRLLDSAGADGPRERRAVDRDMESRWFKGQIQLLDLDNLSFHQGGLLMANKKCELPDGSFRTPHKGYEEVHVPALKPSPYGTNEKIVKISDIPSWAQPAFAGMQQLNRVQSKVYDTALFKPDNILLCAPTGAGKTNVAVLTILHQIGLHMKDGEFDNTKYKIVHVAPIKALVAEVVGNLSARLQDFGLTVRELSGDQNLTKQQIDETHVIATTPEKWDIVTRKSGDRTYTQMVKLLIIDEIHLLHDNRGPLLESIVSRAVRQIETTKEHIRLVGLSATLPNYGDVAVFLRVRSEGLFHFDNSYRPCPLAQQYIGITVRKALQRFQLMNEICYEKVMAAAGKHQVLIFVHSRKETSKTARAIRDTASWLGYTYLYIRMLRNPALYGLPADIVETDKVLDERKADFVQDEVDEDDDDVAELNRLGGMQVGGELDDEDMQNSSEGLNVNVQDIDAYWLQRKITQAYADIDPQQSQKLAEVILKIIAEGDDRDVENRLVMELDYEKFDLIKLVLRNRFKIVWCTLLARAEDQEDRKKIEGEMMGNPSLVPIVEQLHATRASAKGRQKNLEKSIRDEAKRLLDSAGADGPRERRAVDRDMESRWLKGPRQLLDLDNLSFHQGGLLMANKKCWSILLLFLLLALSFSTMGATADSDGAWCDAHGLSIQLSTHCEVTEELQSRNCCDAIFATLGRNGCLCKVVQEPEFRTSGMAGGSIIVQMYYTCDGGPPVSADAEEECDKVESSPPPPPQPPSPPSPAREHPKLPGHIFWIRAGLILGALVVFTLVICGFWKLCMWIRNRWFPEGRGHRLGGQLPWWRVWCNRIKQVLQERRVPAPATPPLFPTQPRQQRVFNSFDEISRGTSR